MSHTINKRPKDDQSDVEYESKQSTPDFVIYCKGNAGATRLGDCPFTQKALICLSLHGLKSEKIFIDLANKPKDFLNLNKVEDDSLKLIAADTWKATAPVLEDKKNKVRIFDSGEICNYLEANYKPAVLAENNPNAEDVPGAKTIFGQFIALIKDVSSKNNGVLNDEVDKDKMKAFKESLASFDGYLAQISGAYLNGTDKISLLDIQLIPMLHLCAIHAEHALNINVTNDKSEYKNLSKYLNNAYSQQWWKENDFLKQDSYDQWRARFGLNSSDGAYPAPPQMEYRMLGATGLKVSVLGLGTMSFTSLEQSMALMSAVRKYGVNFFDNAELYGQPCGEAERLFGAALKKLQEKDPNLWRRSSLVITTKLYFGVGDGNQPNSPVRPYGPNEVGLSRKHLMEGMDASLERLGLEYVDVIMAHRHDPLTPMLEIVRGFTDIINKGKALYWGTSMWTAQKLTEAYWVAKMYNLIPPVAEQPIYNMFTRQYVECDYLPMFQAPYSLGTTTWSPLHMGYLTGKYVKEIPKDSRYGGNSHLGKNWYGNKIDPVKNAKVAELMVIAKEMNVSMVSLALGWVIKNKNVSVCLLGGSKPHQLEQNMDAITTAAKLNVDLMKKIDEVLKNTPKPDSMYAGWRRKKEYITDPL